VRFFVDPEERKKTMAWTLTGELVETCSCNMLCPCWYGVKELMLMDRGWCASPILFRIRQGNADGVDLSGINVVFAGFFPGPTLYDGDGTARLYVDDAISDAQQQALEAIMHGKQGGPMEIVGGLLSTYLPTRRVPIAVQEANGTISATVGDVGQITSQRLKNETGQPMTMQNVGFAMVFQFENHTAELAPSDGTRWSDPDLPEQWESRSGAVGQFRWSGA
jgi:hypothetical protein